MGAMRIMGAMGAMGWVTVAKGIVNFEL